MKLVTEYLADAAKFDQLAALEQHPQVREQLKEQATAYRKLAEKRAKQLGVPLPESVAKEPGVGRST
jgi:F0F1-type ATP synthase membrane subunit b/b'